MKILPSILLALAAVALLWFAGRDNLRLTALREAERISAATPLENAPPLVALTTVALGGFRGLLADVLWLRISYRQDEGDYFELVQLSDWITKLEPRCSEIWAFHAWNLAYNVSVMFPSPADRWRWVENGMDLLRDEGIVYNPGAPMLYCELGWLFQHKIGTASDEAHLFYKRQWSEAMRLALGEPFPDYAALSANPSAMQRLRDEYKLLPEIMQQIDALYGPLNWLCPETHAVYWAYRGRQQAPDGIFLPADRMIYQSLAAMFRYGGRAWWLASQPQVPAPDPACLPGVLRAFRDALVKYNDETVRHAYLEFLASASLLLAKHDDLEHARALYEKLRGEEPNAGLPEDFEVFQEQDLQ